MYCEGEMKVMKTVWQVILAILAVAALVAAVLGVGWVLSKFHWTQTKAFQESATIAYLVTLTLRLIFSWPRVRNSERAWVQKAVKAAEAIYWTAAIFYAAVLFN